MQTNREYRIEAGREPYDVDWHEGTTELEHARAVFNKAAHGHEHVYLWAHDYDDHHELVNHELVTQYHPA